MLHLHYCYYTSLFLTSKRTIIPKITGLVISFTLSPVQSTQFDASKEHLPQRAIPPVLCCSANYQKHTLSQNSCIAVVLRIHQSINNLDTRLLRRRERVIESNNIVIQRVTPSQPRLELGSNFFSIEQRCLSVA